MDRLAGAKPESERLVRCNSNEGSSDRVNSNNIVDLVSKNLLPDLDQKGQLGRILKETDENNTAAILCKVLYVISYRII